jgi:NADPH:quinone reductase-like Zn-dependent oxidoreductase
VQVAGDLAGKTVLVQGGAGAVGACALRIAGRFALDDIALAHERMERGAPDGRILLEM